MSLPPGPVGERKWQSDTSLQIFRKGEEAIKLRFLTFVGFSPCTTKAVVFSKYDLRETKSLVIFPKCFVIFSNACVILPTRGLFRAEGREKGKGKALRFGLALLFHSKDTKDLWVFQMVLTFRPAAKSDVLSLSNSILRFSLVTGPAGCPPLFCATAAGGAEERWPKGKYSVPFRTNCKIKNYLHKWNG